MSSSVATRLGDLTVAVLVSYLCPNQSLPNTAARYIMVYLR